MSTSVYIASKLGVWGLFHGGKTTKTQWLRFLKSKNPNVEKINIRVLAFHMAVSGLWFFRLVPRFYFVNDFLSLRFR
jgi:hypothetical protein